MFKIHSVLFPLDFKNKLEWLKEHKLKPIKKAHITENFHRYRIIDPKMFNSFITKKLKNGISLVLGQLQNGGSEKPLFSYPGGKRSELDIIKEHMPKNFKTFIEPFVGAGALYFDLDFEGKNIISDTFVDLINFYKFMKSKANAKKLYDFMEAHPSTDKNFTSILNNESMDRTIKWFYIKSYSMRGLMTYNKSGKFTGRRQFRGDKSTEHKKNFEYLLNPGYQELLNRTEILNDDFETVMKKYNSPDNFVFLDPPYYSGYQKYHIDDEFDEEEHLRLYEVLKTTKNKCLMLIGAGPYSRLLYKDFIKGEYVKKYVIKITDKTEREERILIIKNY